MKIKKLAVSHSLSSLVAGLGFLVVFCVGMIGCSTNSESPGEASKPLTRLSDRTASLESGGTYRYDRGILSVPENRGRQSARSIDLEFHRLPWTGEGSGNVPPIFVLKGGPGFEGLEDDLARVGYYEFFLERYTRLADVVVVGQRGFGNSGPLPCPDLPAVSIDQVDSARERQARLRTGMQVCRRLYEDQGVDLSGYNVVEMAHDVAAVASALGYEDIQLVGNSFGSHWGMAILREYPQLVSRVTFSALEGPDHTFDHPLEVDAALRRIADAARPDPGQNDQPATPNLLDRFRGVVSTAELSPMPVQWQPDEESPAQEILLDGDALRLLSRGYSRGTTWRHLLPAWPQDLETMIEGNFYGGVRRLTRWWLSNEMDSAAYFSAECGSGISAKRAADIAASTGASASSVNELLADGHCDAWPSDLGPDFREPFETDTPALLIHGDWDTSTPIENAAVVRSMFSNHHFVVIRGGSHGAWREAEESAPEFQQAVLAWIATGSAERLPKSLSLPPLTFLPAGQNLD
ncbi:MAG: alpha/beta hydrolase [Pseudomonadota bacterium]